MEGQQFLSLLAESLAEAGVDYTNKADLHLAVTEAIKSLPELTSFKGDLLNNKEQSGQCVWNILHDNYIEAKYGKLEKPLTPFVASQLLNKDVNDTDLEEVTLKAACLITNDCCKLYKNLESNNEFSPRSIYYSSSCTSKEIQTIVDSVVNVMEIEFKEFFDSIEADPESIEKLLKVTSQNMSIIKFQFLNYKGPVLTSVARLFKLFLSILSNEKTPSELSTTLTTNVLVNIKSLLGCGSEAVEFLLDIPQSQMSNTIVQKIYSRISDNLQVPTAAIPFGRYLCCFRKGKLAKAIGTEKIMITRQVAIPNNFVTLIPKTKAYTRIKTAIAFRDYILNNLSIESFKELLELSLSISKDVESDDINGDTDSVKFDNALFTVDTQGLDDLIDEVKKEEEIIQKNKRNNDDDKPTKRKANNNKESKKRK